MKEQKNIFIIDDDVELCHLLREYLESEGLAVTFVHDGRQGVTQTLQGDIDLVILDVMLPELNGFDTLKEIRAQSSIPVIMLTARGDDIDRIVGLELGADDYLPKPFNPRELVARIRAILRRIIPNDARASSELLEVADITIDLASRNIFQNGQKVHLTDVERQILEMLMQGAGQVVERKMLARTVLGRELSYEDRSVDVHISNLRRKLGVSVNGVERIQTVRGIGYVYALARD